ncbi:Uncharacterised protein [Mycobacterium tuberculosis]|nr:Uncharacterised protein [Mycobacterium tuberculosis]
MPNTLPRCLTCWLDKHQMSFQTVLLVEPSWIWGFIPSMLLFVFLKKLMTRLTMLNSLTIALT